MDGRVWIIDPIDGTLNFVFQRENFAIMVGIYEEGIGQLGFIYDVVKEELYWGGVDIGVFCNDQKLSTPKNLGAKDGLWGMNGAIYAKNIGNVQKIGKESMGVRIIGSAGIEFISLLRGSTVGYISDLYPWDYAAGMVLVNEFGFKGSFLDGSQIDFQDQEKFIVATDVAYGEVMENIVNF
jgi:myo-inositol-1(or 4)-monophosphatase